MTTEEINKYDAVIFRIPKDWIDNKYFIEIDNSLKKLLEEPIIYENRLLILIDGYDDDPRPLWEITEVREYFKTLDLLFPYWFYFFNKNKDLQNLVGIKLLMLLLVSTKTIKKTREVATTEYDIPEFKNFMNYHFRYLNELTDKLNLSLEENKKISKEVIECLQ